MKPTEDNDVLQIPLTFDSKGGASSRSANTVVWFWLVIVVWFVAGLLTIVGNNSPSGLLIVLVETIVMLYILRFIVFRELFYRRMRRELMDNNYVFKDSLFWGIYEIGSKYPYIVKFSNGLRGVFISFDKGAIIGKEDGSEFDHYEAVAEAYKQMARRGIECMHIDYMDTVGSDSRMNTLFKNAESIMNPDLKKVIMMMYDNTLSVMNESFSTYDVYCFYSHYRDDLFWSEMQVVLRYFHNANYVRSRALSRDKIASIVESVMNVSDFSINKANNSIMQDMGSSVSHIKAIWVEKDGVRTVLSKTAEEIDETRRIVRAEKSVKKNKRGKISRLRKKNVEVDLFDDVENNMIVDQNSTENSIEDIDIFDDTKGN